MNRVSRRGIADDIKTRRWPVDPLCTNYFGLMTLGAKVVRQTLRVELDAANIPRRKVRRHEQDLHRLALIIVGGCHPAESWR